MSKLGCVLAAFLAFAMPCNARADDCNSNQSRTGMAKIANANPGDWAKVELKCGGVSLANCTATVAGGATSADCTFPKTALTNGLYECLSTSSNPKVSSGGTCN
jgi:hypothetical protein